MRLHVYATVAAVCLLPLAASAQDAKPTDPQIAHIAYTAGQIDVEAAKQAQEREAAKAAHP